MSKPNSKQNVNILPGIQYPRLREALAVPGVGPSASSPSSTFSDVSKGSRSAKRMLGGATVTLLIALFWFMFASAALVDYSDYSDDPTTPQIVRQQADSSAPLVAAL